MLSIYKCVVKEKKKFIKRDGDALSVDYVKRNYNFILPDTLENVSRYENNIKHNDFFQYVLEEVDTGKLFSLKVYEGDLNLSDVIYIGEKNGKIITYSNNKFDDAESISQSEGESCNVRSVGENFKIEKKDIINAILAFIGFLLPFLSTWMNFRLAFKHDYTKIREEHPEINIMIVRGLCAVCGFMPIYNTAKALLFSDFNLYMGFHVYYRSVSKWGFISAVVIVGGFLYYKSQKQNDIENFKNKIK